MGQRVRHREHFFWYHELGSRLVVDCLGKILPRLNQTQERAGNELCLEIGLDFEAVFQTKYYIQSLI